MTDAEKKLEERLRHLSELPDGWDDESAPAIFPESVENVRAAAREDGRWTLRWAVFPDVNGTLTLCSKTKKSCVSVGVREFSYYGSRGGETASGGNVPFDVAKLAKVLNDLD